MNRQADDKPNSAPRVAFDQESDKHRPALLLDKARVFGRVHPARGQNGHDGELPLAESEDVLMELEFHNNRRLHVIAPSRSQLRALVGQAQRHLESS